MKRGIIIVLLLNLVLVAVLVAGVLVVRRGLGALAENQEKLVLLEQKKKELGELRRLFDETREERTAIDAYFVSGNAFPVFIEQLEGLASSTTVALDISAAAIIGEVEKEKDKTKINAPRFQLHMTVMARFADLFRFLSLVELMPVQVVFEGAEFVSKTPEIWSGSFVLSLLSYTENENTQAKN